MLDVWTIHNPTHLAHKELDWALWRELWHVGRLRHGKVKTCQEVLSVSFVEGRRKVKRIFLCRSGTGVLLRAGRAHNSLI